MFGRGSPAELQQHRKLITLSHFGYLSRSSCRFSALSSAFSYSSAMDSGICFFCHSLRPADMIFDTNGIPYVRDACTMLTFGRCSSISTPYFLAVALTWSFVACISSPVLKNTYLIGGKPNASRVRSIRSIIISLSEPPEYEQIAFGCCVRCRAIILCIAWNFAGES